MIYTITQSKDPEMYEMWGDGATRNGKPAPMLCTVIHEDCLDNHVVATVREAGEATVYFKFTSE